MATERPVRARGCSMLALGLLFGCQAIEGADAKSSHGSSVAELTYGTSSDVTNGLVGAGFYRYTDGSVGVYFNSRFSLADVSPDFSDFVGLPGFTPGTRTGERAIGYVFDVGLTHRVSRRLGLFAGLGFAFEQSYGQYRGPTPTVPQDLTYYLEESDRDGVNVNLGGHLLLGDHFALSVQYDSFFEACRWGSAPSSEAAMQRRISIRDRAAGNRRDS